MFLCESSESVLQMNGHCIDISTSIYTKWIPKAILKQKLSDNAIYRQRQFLTLLLAIAPYAGFTLIIVSFVINLLVLFLDFIV